MNNKQTTLANTNFRCAVRTFCNRALSFVWQCNWDPSRAAYPSDWPDIWNPVQKHRNSHLPFMDITKFLRQVCIPAFLSLYLSTFKLVKLTAYLHSVYLSTCLPICLSNCLPACLSICLSVCLPVCLFVYLSLCLYVYNSYVSTLMGWCNFNIKW